MTAASVVLLRQRIMILSLSFWISVANSILFVSVFMVALVLFRCSQKLIIEVGLFHQKPLDDKYSGNYHYFFRVCILHLYISDNLPFLRIA